MRHKSSRRGCGLCLEPARILTLASMVFWLLATAGCSHAPKEVDDAALRAGESDVANWITYGRTYSEQRFSPLKQIDMQTAIKLRRAFPFDADQRRGLEATSLVKD